MSWTDDRVEKLKAMWGEGQSASQIAKALGGVTRNAVIGKVHRLGLSNRATGAKSAASSAAPTAEAKPAKAAPKSAPAAAPAPTAETVVVAAPATPHKPVIQSSTMRREPPPPTPAMVEDAARTAQALAAIQKKAKKLDLLELTERTCKWPIGDPATEDFYFCGLGCAPGKPYCDAHVAVAFQPMSSRRDRDRNRNRATAR
ncbi:MAG: GcrA family cell cycle regulator [Paracoccaceae bacterium]|jgi:GcrA cell cycle regulator|nr:GcrA family cell cycle regulator [Paracoccaceae bacterium]MDG1970034.1 GcrA family cell cycle regulator [Paracoccaceae bacterium]